MIPVVALVGRPNVGKSSLYNRLVGDRQAVVSDVAGTTRDRLSRVVTFGKRQAYLMDMAGIEPALKEATEIRRGMQEQVETGLREATVILWVVDAMEPVTEQDRVVGELLRRLGKPVVVALNKADNVGRESAALELAELGYGEVYPVSAIHGRGVVALQHAIAERLPESEPIESKNELQVAIVGRPNVGKSTLLNQLSGELRSVVSAEAGTTRDAIDTVFPAAQLGVGEPWDTVRCIDTAGVRRRGKIEKAGLEGWSVLRTYAAIDVAHVALVLLDATELLVHQDTQVLAKVGEAGRPVVLVVNKWDAYLASQKAELGSSQDEVLRDKVLGRLLREAPFLSWAPVVFLSAKEGWHTADLGNVLQQVVAAWQRRVTEDEIQPLFEHLKTYQPAFRKMKSLVFQRSEPPTFAALLAEHQQPHFSTVRFLENFLRDSLELGPTPVKIWVDLVKRQTRKR